ncbi:MAG: undecaprenyl diphosphate synthase [Petroclostridium sp.]|jgi:undecaprenyl diphosphate synthase|nr:isoprenyl transferase [Clostridia bacterium]MDK2810791.1 undecaprenyl diphosphate synthase [Petroclostridium sp.]
MEKYKNDMPLHIAMIMDGNGRWAKKRMMPRTYGHKEGCENLKRISMACNDLGIKYLTVYAFSTENWKRSASEVATLMDLFNKYLEEASSQFIENNIKIKVIGDKSKLSPNLQRLIARTETITSSHTGLHLQVAFNYGGRDEIIRAIEKIMTDVSKSEEIKVTEELFSTYLDTAGVPEPDLLIRTGGEKRLSNYLLWELAYSELYFSNTLWPDFTKEELVKIIEMYRYQERRYGNVTAI